MLCSRPDLMRSSLVRASCVVIASAALAVLAFTAIAAPEAGRPAKLLPATGRPALAAPAATAALGLDLLRVRGRGNLVLSPDSIGAALAMVGTGAAGTTAGQIAHVLHLASPAGFPSLGRLQGTIAAEQLQAGAGDSQAPQLDLANDLFVQSGLALLPGFLGGLAQDFGVPGPQTVDFEKNSPAAVQAINEWVSSHTQGIIPKILSSLDTATRLLLANAIYLKAGWLHPFKTSASAPGAFHAEHARVPATFMHQTETLRYGRGHGYAAVDLPYRSSTLSLLIMLPVGESVAALSQRLGATRLASIARALSPRPVKLTLPRFHLQTSTMLNGTLVALGMRAAFTAGANFSAITKALPLQIGQVDHAADFMVDEEGTIAAAATVVSVEATAERVPLSNPVPFTANRPFLFFLRDDRTGAVLFAGRLNDPSQP
jgi:serpin B